MIALKAGTVFTQTLITSLVTTIQVRVLEKPCLVRRVSRSYRPCASSTPDKERTC